jgi:hypothetical protein
MSFEQRIEALENSVSYLLSEFSGETFEQIEQDVSFLLTQVEGKTKLFQLINSLQKYNKELSLQRNKLMHEKVNLQEALFTERALTKALQSKLNI